MVLLVHQLTPLLILVLLEAVDVSYTVAKWVSISISSGKWAVGLLKVAQSYALVYVMWEVVSVPTSNFEQLAAQAYSVGSVTVCVSTE